MSGRTVGYWASTGVFCLMLGFSGVAHTLRIDMVAEGMVQMRYPEYVMTLLGLAKLAGVAALLVPGQALLKEWAYAGFTFLLTGATLSHVFVGDPVGDVASPAVLLVIGAASYALRPASRRLPVAPSAAQAAH